MSHKTGDRDAGRLADHIFGRHGVYVYMAEWDDDITDHSAGNLPDHLMEKIKESDGFLVNVTSQIAVSMWVGYEIGGAHALDKPRAKYDHTSVLLPSVVEALETLTSLLDLSGWIEKHILGRRFTI